MIQPFEGIEVQTRAPSTVEFLDHLRRLVIDESLTARQNLLEQWSQPLSTRVRQGRAIEGLRVVQVRQV